MARRQASSFRPTLDPLESRVVLSASPTVPSAAEVASLPILTPGTLHRVMDAIHEDFVIYNGEDAKGILNTIGGYASDVASYLWSAADPNASSNTDDSSSDDGSVAGGKGDSQALHDRLLFALEHLPFEAGKAPELFTELFGGAENLTTADQFKSQVMHDLRAGRQAGEFVYGKIDPHHPAPPSATVQPDPGSVS